MKEIKLTQSQVALVDDCDFKKLAFFKWFAHKDGKIFYARRSFWINGKQDTIQMHYEIMGKPPAGLMTDHINGQGTDNRRKNLRFVTSRQNQQNQNNAKTSSKYPGVCWDKTRGKWMVGIKANGKRKFLGRFINEEEAFEAYKRAVNDLGETIISK